MQGFLEECLYLVILDLEGPDGLTQLKFRSEEGGRAPLLTETLLLLAELLLLPGGLFSVLRALQLGQGPALPVRNPLVPVGDFWPPAGLDPGLASVLLCHCSDSLQWLR